MTTANIPASSRLASGTIAAGFEPVLNELNAYLLTDPEYSAQLAIYVGDDLVVDLVGGPDLDADSITGVFSSTKGVSAITLATLIDDGALDLDALVARYWPEFGQAGKENVTVRQLLSHQVGLVGVPGGFLTEEFLDSTAGAEKIAKARPIWATGSIFGYNGLTVGIYLDELVRRIAGTSIQDLYEKRVRAPREIDFYLGVPDSEEPRYREVLPLHPTPAQSAEMAANPRPQDDTASHMYNSIFGEFSPALGPLSPNRREVRSVGPSAVGGVGSARGLAKLYASVIGDRGGAGRILSEQTVEVMSQQQVWGVDRVLNVEMCFGIVFEKPQPRMEFGSYQAFGHDGAGGSLAFADPMYDLGFGYIPNPIQYPGGADVKAVRLSQIARACIRRLS